MSLSNYRYSLGVDIGGTNITVALVDRKGNIIKKMKYSADIQEKIEVFVQHIAAELEEISKGVPVSSIRGIGIGAAGLIDHKKGAIKDSPNMYRNRVPLVSLLKRKIKNKNLSKLPVSLENDANAAAWGAYKLEVPAGVKDMICVTLGTGVGGGVIIDGRIYRGFDGLAGELGHVAVNPSGPRCNCGSYGCLERYTGSGYIVERVVREIKKGSKTKITGFVDGKLNRITPKIITEAAKKKDALAKKTWKETGEYLGIGLAGVINVLNPEAVVFSGGVSRAGSLFLEPMKKVIRKRSYVSRKKPVKYIISRLGDDLGVIGAAMLVSQFNEKKNR